MNDDWRDPFERRATRGTERRADAVFDAASIEDYAVPAIVRRSHRAPALVAAGALVVAVAGGGLVLRSRDGDPSNSVDAAIATECTVYLRPESAPERLYEIRALVVASGDLESVEVLTQADAYEEFRVMFTDKPELIASVTPEVLPPSVRGSLVDPTDERKLAFEAHFDGMPDVRDAVCFPGLEPGPSSASPYDCWVTPVPGVTDAAQQPIRDAIESDDNVVSYTYGDTSSVPTLRYQIVLDDSRAPAKDVFIRRVVQVSGVAEVGCVPDR